MRRYATSFFGVVDLLAVLPSYLILAAMQRASRWQDERAENAVDVYYSFSFK